MLQVRTASGLCDTPQRTWSVWPPYKTNFEFNYQNLITSFFLGKDLTTFVKVKEMNFSICIFL